MAGWIRIRLHIKQSTEAVMYEAFYGFSQRPFASAPSPQRYFPASSIDTARQTLARVTDRAEGICLVIGAPGVGKTVLLQVLADAFRERFATALLSAGQLETRRELLQAVSFELGLPYQNKDEGDFRLSLVDRLVRSNEYPHGMLLLVDEAHVLPTNVLEELRMITNLARDGEPRVRLVLAGTMALEDRLTHPQLESFNQRLAARCYLDNFDAGETTDYVRYQVAAAGGQAQDVFTVDATVAVHRATDGIPRLINQICDQALLLAHAAGERPVGPRWIGAAWEEMQQIPAPWNDDPADECEDRSVGAVVEFGRLESDDETAAESAAAKGEAAAAPPESVHDSVDSNKEFDVLEATADTSPLSESAAGDGSFTERPSGESQDAEIAVIESNAPDEETSIPAVGEHIGVEHAPPPDAVDANDADAAAIGSGFEQLDFGRETDGASVEGHAEPEAAFPDGAIDSLPEVEPEPQAQHEYPSDFGDVSEAAVEHEANPDEEHLSRIAESEATEMQPAYGPEQTSLEPADTKNECEPIQNLGPAPEADAADIVAAKAEASLDEIEQQVDSLHEEAGFLETASAAEYAHEAAEPLVAMSAVETENPSAETEAANDSFEEEALIDPYAAMEAASADPGEANAIRVVGSEFEKPSGAPSGADESSAPDEDTDRYVLELSEDAEFWEVVVDPYAGLAQAVREDTESDVALDPPANKETAKTGIHDRVPTAGAGESDRSSEPIVTQSGPVDVDGCGGEKHDEPPAPNQTIMLSDAVRRSIQAKSVSALLADDAAGADPSELENPDSGESQATSEQDAAETAFVQRELVLVEEESGGSEAAQPPSRTDYRQLFARLKQQ